MLGDEKKDEPRKKEHTYAGRGAHRGEDERQKPQDKPSWSIPEKALPKKTKSKYDKKVPLTSFGEPKTASEKPMEPSSKFEGKWSPYRKEDDDQDVKRARGQSPQDKDRDEPAKKAGESVKGREQPLRQPFSQERKDQR